MTNYDHLVKKSFYTDMPHPGNEDRRSRILDAAVNLFVRYGFDKTTVSDIAREAGISKGAVYLDFSSKDELIEALLLRETQLYSERWLELIEADPDGGAISGMYKNMLVALNASAFMSAIFKKDRRVLGNYLRKPNNWYRQQQHQSTRYEFVRMMQDAGAIRKDIDARVTAHIMNMLAYGLVAMDEIMDEKDIPPTEDVIEGIADFMERALSPEGGGDRQAGKAILKDIADQARAFYEEAPTETGAKHD